MKKKIIFLILIILLIFFLIYFLNKINLKNKNINKEENKNINENIEKDILNPIYLNYNNITENTEKEIELIKKLTSSSNIKTYWFYEKNIFYINDKSEIFKINEKNQHQKITNFYEPMILIKTNISLDNKKILVNFNNPYQPQWLIFDNLDLTWRPLPENIIEANWLSNDEIIAIVKDNNNYKLIKINKDFNSQTILNNFNFFDFYIFPINNEKIILQEKPESSRAVNTKIFILDLKNYELKSLKEDNLNYLLIKPINENLFLKYSDLEYLKIDYKNNQEKILVKTLINKCTWVINENNITFYCFIPKENVNLTQYLQREIITNDNVLLKINLTKNNENNITITQERFNLLFDKIDADQITYLNNELYFINRYDNNLYKINLDNLISPPIIDENIDVTEN